MAPSSGQPYNQIAILEANRSNKLSTVYFYVRAVCLSFPFPAACINLSKLLARLAGIDDAEDRTLRERTAKVTQHTFIPLFLRIQGLLHHASHLRQCVRWTNLLTEALTSLVATDSLSTWQLLQMTSINMWVWQRASPALDTEEVSREERLTLGLCADLQAAILTATLLPVYTVKKGDQLLEYSALPAVRVLLEWIILHPAVLSEGGFTSRGQIWPGLARLLNEVQLLAKDFDPTNLNDFPLPEEYDLQAFKPLLPSLSGYNYKLVNNGPIINKEELAMLRFTRLLAIGDQLTRPPFSLLTRDVVTGSTGSATTESGATESATGEWRPVEKQHPQGEDLEELAESLESEKGDMESSEDEDEDSASIQWEEQQTDSSARSILKSKGKDQIETSSSNAPRYRARQNVAMAAIMRANQDQDQNQNTQEKGEQEEDKEKRVMFKVPSPAPHTRQESPVEEETRITSNTSKAVITDLMANSTGLGLGGGVVSGDPVKPPVSQMSVKEMDFSRPPPSLHSNYRPPQLSGSINESVSSRTTNLNMINNSASIPTTTTSTMPLLALDSLNRPVQGIVPLMQPPLATAGANAAQHLHRYSAGAGQHHLAQPPSQLAAASQLQHHGSTSIGGSNRGGEIGSGAGPGQNSSSQHGVGSLFYRPSLPTTNQDYPDLSNLSLDWRSSSLGQGKSPSSTSSLFPSDSSLIYQPHQQQQQQRGLHQVGLGGVEEGNGGASKNGSSSFPSLEGMGPGPGYSPRNQTTGVEREKDGGGGNGCGQAPAYSLFSGGSWAGSLLAGNDNSPSSSSNSASNASPRLTRAVLTGGGFATTNTSSVSLATDPSASSSIGGVTATPLFSESSQGSNHSNRESGLGLIGSQTSGSIPLTLPLGGLMGQQGQQPQHQAGQDLSGVKPIIARNPARHVSPLERFLQEKDTF